MPSLPTKSSSVKEREMKTTTFFLGAKSIDAYEVVKGKRAEEWLHKHGFTYVSVDDEGNIHSRNANSKTLDDLRVYRREVDSTAPYKTR